MKIKKKKTFGAGLGMQGTAAAVRMTPRFSYFVAGFVSLVTFSVYLSCLHNEFVIWDDNFYVFDNPHLHPLNAAFFRWAFSAFYAANWHPLTWVSHALDYAVWGLNPLGHHLTNNILHAVNTFIVVVLVVKLLEAWHASRGGSYTESVHKLEPEKEVVIPAKAGIHYLSKSLDSRLCGNDGIIEFRDRHYIVIAAVTGLLFGLHPLHVESVAWVSERKGPAVRNVFPAQHSGLY